MAITPNVSVSFLDGQLQSTINTADEVCLKVGAATDGPFLTPLRCSSLAPVLQFRHGPLVKSGAHHTDYSGPCYLMRCTASTPGAVSSVTKTPGSGVLASLSTLTLALQSYTLHASVPAGTTGSGLTLATGWTAPPASLPLKIVVGGAGHAVTATVTGVNSAGNTVVEVVTITVSGGTFYTTGHFASVISVVLSADPNDTTTFTSVWAGPGDRYSGLAKCVTGGVLGVSGGTTPTWKLSLDGGVTYGRTTSMPSSGVVEIQTYAGGLAAQSTGIAATWSAGSLAQTALGAVRVVGATVNGDVVANLLVAGTQVAVAVAGMGTSLSCSYAAPTLTINSATGGGGAATTTGAAAVDYILNSSNADAVVARGLFTPTAVGTGLGLLAAFAAAGAANGGVTATAKVEGARFRIVNGGTSKTHSVAVVGSDVTLYADTDSNGAQTTTATNAAAYLATDSVAGPIANWAATGSGAGIVGALGAWFALPVSVATGDAFTFTTTPPAPSDADVQAAVTALLANEAALSAFSVLHVVAEAEDTMDAVLATFVVNAQARKRQYKTVVVEAPWMGSTAEATWLASTLATFATKSTLYGIAAGEANVLNSAYGTVDRVNCATPYVARLMTCPISELPSHVDCETILGTRNALDGVLVRQNAGDMPLWQTDDTLATLNTSNFVTLRTHPGRSGIYVRQGLQFTVDGSDYTYVSNRRVANVAAALAYDEGLRFLNSVQLGDSQTGQIAEAAAQKFEAQVGGRLRKKLVGSDNGRQHCSALAVTLDRETNYVSTGQISAAISIVPRTPATDIRFTVGFAITLGPNAGR